MRVLIDNLDGLGFVDYTSCVCFGSKTVIHRTLNAPSTCELRLVLNDRLTAPELSARVVVQSSSGAYLFTGFIDNTPEAVCIGRGCVDVAEEIMLHATSDEAQLDVNVWKTGTTLLGGTAAQNWQMLGLAAAQGGLQLILSDGLTSASRVILPAGDTWSKIAGKLASQTRSSYRSLNGMIEVKPLGSSEHSISRCGSQVAFSPLNTNELRWQADDITILGHIEPDAYVTEIFEGDGTTSTFALNSVPFGTEASQALQLTDQFQGNVLNTQLWMLSDAGSHIGLTKQGLTCAGGSGRTSESFITSVQAFELGGNFLVEAEGVQLQVGSQGIIIGLFTASPTASTCFAGFMVDTIEGAVSLTPIINGALTGNSFTISSSSTYTLRLWISVLTLERINQTYCYQGDQASVIAGGDTEAASGWLSVDVQEIVSGASGLSQTLYQAAVPSIPTACHFAPLVSGSLMCGIQSVSCNVSAPTQVTTMAPGSPKEFLKQGTLASGGAYYLEDAKAIKFYPPDIPSAGTLLLANYRNVKRTAARRILRDSTSKTLASSWVGEVIEPPALSSLDCENAAKALLESAGANINAIRGNYEAVLPFADDFWPGDSLVIGDFNIQTSESAIIRQVQASIVNADAELVKYRISFANDSAELISIRLTTDLPEPALLPSQATNLDQALDNLSSLTIMSADAHAFTMDVGCDAPINGGFEVRRRDRTFGVQNDSDLVLRTSARLVSIPRLLAVEQFFVRMYDGSSPPRYSAVSAAIFLNLLS